MTTLRALLITVVISLAIPGLAYGERVALYIGTFDPVHLGHVDVATTVRDVLNMSRIIIWPKLRSPGKMPVAVAERTEMLQRATKGLAKLEVYGVKPGAPRKLVPLVGRLVKPWLRNELFVIWGQDLLTTKRRAAVPLLRAMRIRPVVVLRDTSTWKPVSRLMKVLQSPIASLEKHSSSQIRTQIAQSGDTSGLAPNVARYIRKRGLYGSRSTR